MTLTWTPVSEVQHLPEAQQWPQTGIRGQGVYVCKHVFTRKVDKMFETGALQQSTEHASMSSRLSMMWPRS